MEIGVQEDAVAAGTGFRIGELRTLIRRAFRLVADPPAACARCIREAADPAEGRRRHGGSLRPVDTAGQRVDFHSLRGTFIMAVVQTGATLKEAMDLARHSDPRLTMKLYSRIGLRDLADHLPAAVEAEPAEAVATLATGTEGPHRGTNGGTNAGASPCITLTLQRPPTRCG